MYWIYIQEIEFFFVFDWERPEAKLFIKTQVECHSINWIQPNRKQTGYKFPPTFELILAIADVYKPIYFLFLTRCLRQLLRLIIWEYVVVAMSKAIFLVFRFKNSCLNGEFQMLIAAL